MLAAVCGALGSEVRADGVFGVAGDYNEFILGNSTRVNVDSQGRVAVGGNATFTNFAVASGESAGSQVNLVVGGALTAHSSTVKGSIVTGGNATYTNPTVQGNFSSNGSLTLGSYGTVSGDIRYGTTYTQSTTTVSGAATGPVSTPLPVDFAAEGAYLKALSLAQYDANDPTGHFEYNALTFTGGTGSNFFNTTGAQLQSAVSGINIVAPAGATVVINVTGTGFTIPNTGFNRSGGIALDHVLFNFVDATNLTIAGSARGSFLAPLAAVTTSYGDFYGNLIAGSLTGSIETHLADFDGNLRAVPEPSSLAMLGLGGLGLAGAAWRRRRRPAAC